MEEKSIGGNLPPVLALVFLGDARHSLFVRRMLVSRGIAKSGELNALAQGYVTAEAQAKAFLKIEAHLSAEELGVFKRAFNSTHLNKPKRASGKDYRTATGFEAVIGMLDYLNENERIEELLAIACEADEGDKNDTED
jgi:ribonuclease-3 family protein